MNIDENTAHTLLRNVNITAKITGVNIELMQCFCVTLKCINSKSPINANKFKGKATR